MTDAEYLPQIGQRVVCAVAEQPWLSRNGSGPFCTLIPLLHEDGHPAPGDAFPNRGRVFWMLNSTTDEDFAKPGQLISVKLARSKEAGVPGKDEYQVARDSVAHIDDHGFVEVLDLSSSSIRKPSEFLSRSFPLDHPPCRLVYVIWNLFVYGPLIATSTKRGSTKRFDVTFELPAQNRAKFSIRRVKGDRSHAIQQARKQPLKSGGCQYVLTSSPDLERDMAAAEEISIETDAHVLARTLDRFKLLNRGKRRELKVLLEELGPDLESIEDSEEDVRGIIESLKSAIKIDRDRAHRLAEEICATGVLSSQIDNEIKRVANLRANRIDAAIQSEIAERQKMLMHLRQEQETLNAELQRRKEEADQDLQAIRAQFESKLNAEHAELEHARREIEGREENFRAYLEPLTERLETARTEIIHQYLAISPLLRWPSTGSVNGEMSNSTGDRNEPSAPRISVRSGKSIIKWPEFIHTRLRPILAEWRPHVVRQQAEVLHACVLGCRCSLLPDPTWGAAYAEAIGGRFTLIHVEPDWLNFSRAWEGICEDAWNSARSDDGVMHFLMFAGVNRSPTSAWALPILSIAGGFSDSLPVGNRLSWPENLRVLFTFDSDSASFTPHREFVYASGAFRCDVSDRKPNPPGKLNDGHVTADTWLSWANPQTAESIILNDFEMAKASSDGNACWYRARRRDMQRLVRILSAAGMDENDPVRLARKIRSAWPMEYSQPTKKRG